LEEEPARKGLMGAISEYASRGLLLFVLLFLTEVGVFLLVVSLPFFPGEKAIFVSQSNQIGSEFKNASLATQFFGIFTNNFRIGLIEMIPGLGSALFAFSLYSTARIIEVDALTQGVSPVLLVLFLFIFPYSYLELPAYAVATGEGLYLSYAILRWLFSTGGRPVDFRAEAWQLFVNIMIVAVMLTVAALFESVELQLLQDEPALFWVTWVPFAGIVALAIVLNRRLGRMRREKSSGLSSQLKREDSPHL
jgi:uncharacterized membrane protein SpoIIM required for sporulation